MKKNIIVAIIGLLFAGITVAAQRSYVPPPGGLKFAEPWRPDGAKGDTRVIGTVIDIRQVPVTYAKVRLRDLNTGNIEEETDTNANGEYAFDLERPGSYIVEMVLVDGYVISLSNAGSVARFETLQTVIQLPGRWDAARQNVMPTQSGLGFVGVSSATTMTAATLAIAVDQNIAPVDSGEPVSP